MKVLLRTTLALACLLFAGYWFTRPREPEWTKPLDERLLQFAPDSKSFWTYAVHHAGSADTTVVLKQFQIRDGAVIQEYSIPFTAWLDNCHASMSADGIWISVSINKTEHNESLRACLLNTLTGEMQRIPYLRPMPSAVSPTGRWLFNPSNSENDIYSRTPFRKVQSVDDLRAATGETGNPHPPQFSPDDRCMAVAWNDWIDRNKATVVKTLCIYSTKDWKPVRTMPMPEQGFHRLLNWTSAGLYLKREIHKPVVCGAVSFPDIKETYVLKAPTCATSALEVEFMNDILDSNRKPDDGFDYRGFGGTGEGWYAIRHLSSRPHPAWLLDLKKKFPSLATFVNTRWPQGTETYHLYDSITKQPRGQFRNRGIEEFRFSPDGRWVASLTRPGDQLAMYATAPLSTWGGYVALGLALLVLIGNPARFRSR